MRVLGISAFYHDSAAALVEDGRVIAAAQEERFTRKKHDARFPVHAVRYCLSQVDDAWNTIDYVAFYEKPFLKFERLIETYLTFAPRGLQSFRMALPVWLREKLFLRAVLERELAEASDGALGAPLLFSEHHLSHAASAFYPSPYLEAAILTIDGVGEWATTCAGFGAGDVLELTREVRFPHSLGLLYSAFTYYLGFKVNSGEYKVMGLAPYGTPRFASQIRDHLIDIKPDGSFRLNQEYFDYCTGLRMTRDKFAALFGGPVRNPDVDLLEQRHMDVAASIQAVTDELVLLLTRDLARETRQSRLCLAGGVALNCVANGKVLRDRHFTEVWIQPAAGDAGGAIGSALLAYHQHGKRPRSTRSQLDGMNGAFLGPQFDQREIETELRRLGARFSVLSDEPLMAATADALATGAAVGWFQGRMEFGPRALGARSILADPRSPTMQSDLNLKVKFRESFRPFAPAVLRDRVQDYFELECDSPYMLIVADVHPRLRRGLSQTESVQFGIDLLNVSRSDIPAVTHVDYSARIQTVHAETNPRFHALLRAFEQRTGCAVLVNTSFNVRGEPIVCSPEDAWRCFMGTALDLLVMGNCVLRKTEQDPCLKTPQVAAFEPD